MDPVIENVGATIRDESITTDEQVGEPVNSTCQQDEEKKKKDVHEMERKLKALETEKLHLLSLLSQASAESHGKSSGVDTEDPVTLHHGQGHHPGSIMSLSTGSEESAVEDEKFVKIKPCEMESGSSKASSQSGKENLELEEHIQTLNEQLDSVRKSLKEKEEECNEIKYQLEAILLEKNVESLSISSLSSDLKSIKVSLVAKDEQMDEVNLVLDDLLEQFKAYLPTPEEFEGKGEWSWEGDSLEAKLNLLKGLPAHFKSLEEDGEGLARALSEAQMNLKDLEDGQSDMIGGYQLATQNYEKLQAEFEEYKLRERENGDCEANQLKEELERFREELLSKDEDLMEIQSRCDEFEGLLTQKIRELEIMESKFTELQASAAAAMDEAEAKVKVTESKAKSAEAAAVFIKTLELQASESESRATTAESRATELESRVAELEARAKEVDTKAATAEIRVVEAESKLEQLQSRYAEAKSALKESEVKANQAESRLIDSESKLAAAESRVKECEVAVKQAATSDGISESMLAKAEAVTAEVEVTESRVLEVGAGPAIYPAGNQDKSVETDSTQQVLSPFVSTPESGNMMTLQDRCFEELRKGKLEQQCLQQESENLTAQNSDLLSRISLLQAENQAKDKAIEELHQAKVVFQRLKQEYDSRQARYSDLLIQVSAQETQLEEHSETLEELHSAKLELERIQHEYETMNARNSDLMSQNSELIARVSLHEAENQGHETIVERFREAEIELQRLQADYDSLEARNSDLLARVSLHEVENQEKETVISQLEDTKLELKHLEQELGTLKNQYSDLLSKNSELFSRVTSQDAELLENKAILLDLDTAKVELQRLQHEYESMNVGNAELLSRISSQGAQLQEKERALEEIKSEIEEIRSCVEQKTEEINSTVHSKNLEIEQLMIAYQSYAEAKEKMESDLSGVIISKNSIISQLENEIENIREEREVMKQEQDEVNRMAQEQINSFQNYLTNQISTHAQEVENLQAEIQKHRAEVEANRNKLKVGETQIQELETLLQENEGRILGLVHEVSELQRQVSAANDLRTGELKDVRSRSEGQERELTHLRSEHLRLMTLWHDTKDTVRVEYETKLKEEELLRESEMLVLHQQISSLKQELTNLEAQFTKSESNVLALGEDNSGLCKELEDLKSEKEALQGQVESLKSELEVTRVQNIEMDSESKRQRSEIDVLVIRVSELEKMIREAEEKVKKAEAESLKGQSTMSNESIEKINSLLEEIGDLRNECAGKERKMELLQSKITEIENSEMKAFEESFVLKNWIKQLEFENQRFQDEITKLLNSATKDPSVHPKIVKIQEETLRLIYALDERDKRCVQLTVEITRLLEERDELQLKLSSILKHNLELSMALDGTTPLKEAPIYDKKDLEQKLAQLEDTNFRMIIDLKRERETRKLVQEELLYSQAARMYREREIKSRLGDPLNQVLSNSPSTTSSDSRPLSPDVLDHSPGSIPSQSRKESLQVVHI